MKFIKNNLILNLVVFAFIIFVFGNLVIVAQSENNPATQKNYKFVNGKWFNGKTFKKKIFYSTKGVFSNKKPSQVDETIDLKNAFAIPPFGDAHTHNLDGVRDLDRIAGEYLKEGTFYVQVLANHATGAKEAKPFLNKPSTPDVIYANGMLTCTFGHPFMVYEPLAMGIYNPQDAFRRVDEVKKSRIDENNAYWFLDSKQDVDAKWEKILAANPDIIKIGLIDAQDYEKYVKSGETLNKGLSPEVAEYVIRKAHQANLRVYAHIETANDFRLGVKIGVDGFAHAPYYDWNGSLETKPKDDLTLEDMKLAARKNIVVIPTAQRGTYGTMDFDSNGKGTINRGRFERFVERQKKLFNQMHQNGVRIALGLDNYGSTLLPEILYFHDEQIFDNLTLLKTAAETTPQIIFPKRKIGKLKEGFEASFLVLKGNPLEDFNQIKNIKMRFKQGQLINVEEK